MGHQTNGGNIMNTENETNKGNQQITYPMASLIIFAVLIIYTIIAFIIDANI